MGRGQHPARRRRRRVPRAAAERRDLRGRVRALTALPPLPLAGEGWVRAISCEALHARALTSPLPQAREGNARAMNIRFKLSAEASLQQEVRKSRFVARAAPVGSVDAAHRVLRARARSRRDAQLLGLSHRRKLPLQRRRRTRRHRRPADPAGDRRTGDGSRRGRRGALVRRHQARRRRPRACLRRHAPPSACALRRNRRSSSARIVVVRCDFAAAGRVARATRRLRRDETRRARRRRWRRAHDRAARRPRRRARAVRARPHARARPRAADPWPRTID